MPDVELPNMGLVQFEVNGDVDTWGLGINENSALIDAHNHAFGQGVMIPSAGININADISWGSLYAPINLHRITFASITAITDNAQNKSLFVNSSDNELYWRTNLGTNVKLTTGNSLNVSAFTGGIVGDYSAVGAAEAFDNSNKAYTFKDGAAHFARLDAGGIKLIEFGTSETVGVTLQAPAALASSYAVTWPTALPASKVLTQTDNAGQISFSNTITTALTVNATLGVTALLTASAGFDLVGPLTIKTSSGSTITTAVSGGNNNNFNPTGIASAVLVRLDASGTVGPVITGIAGGTDGRIIYFHNIGNVTISLTHQDVASTAANRIITTTAGVLNLTQDNTITLYYDINNSRWRVLSKTF